MIEVHDGEGIEILEAGPAAVGKSVEATVKHGGTAIVRDGGKAKVLSGGTATVYPGGTSIGPGEIICAEQTTQQFYTLEGDENDRSE